MEIRNLLFQPLTFHLSGDAGGIHLGSREHRAIPEEQLSDEIISAAARGFVALADLPESTQPDPLVPKSFGQVETADSERVVEPASENQAAVRNRKRRQA